MRGYATKGCAIALVIVLFVLAMGTLASACGRCNTPCSWTWNCNSCCTKTYVYPATSYYCGGYSSCYSYCYRPYSSYYSYYRPCSGASYYYRSTCYRSTCGYPRYSCCP